MTAPLGRYLLVELHENLAVHGTTLGVAHLCILQVPGVLDVTDLAAISRETLDDILLVPEAVAEKTQQKKARRRAA